ncbi:MAG: MoxR family ATPase [Chloroflexi bacterium]|nr:MoxR family ATPase [Chloroflexota bacterium]
MLDTSTAKATLESILRQLSTYFVGDELLLKKILAAALSNGHILFEDNPGLGKTLLVKLFAKATGCEFTRIQFTPDMLPADIMGTRIWLPNKNTFETMRGPVFTQILLADEINRATPRTQSALLEAMEERQVTIEGVTHQLPKPFLVLATQNPIELEGTYPLPEAQLDRFALQLSLGYPPSQEDEVEILRRRISWKTDDPTGSVESVCNADYFIELQALVENDVYVDASILDYTTEIVRATREHPRVEVGVSPRGGMSLMKLARGFAVVEGRDYVTPDDIKTLVVDAFAHRTFLKLEDALEDYPVRSVIAEVVGSVEVPTDFRRSPV